MGSGSRLLICFGEQFFWLYGLTGALFFNVSISLCKTIPHYSASSTPARLGRVR